MSAISLAQLNRAYHARMDELKLIAENDRVFADNLRSMQARRVPPEVRKGVYPRLLGNALRRARIPESEVALFLRELADPIIETFAPA